MDLFVNEHASVGIKARGLVIRFDPYNVSPEKKAADIIFITHSHYDHFSPQDIEKIANADTVIAAPESMRNELSYLPYKAEFFTPGETKRMMGITVQAVPAYNTDKPMHKKEYGWLGYITVIENHRIYVCGDTDVTDEALNVQCDVLFVPVGGTYTMDCRQAAELTNALKPDIAIPYHYGTLVGDESCGEEFESLVDSDIGVELLIGDEWGMTIWD